MNTQSNPSDEEKMLAIICHLGPLAGYLVGFGQILVPLGIMLWKGPESEFVQANAKESLNFQISMFIYLFISAILILAIIGIFLLLGLGIFGLVVMILATIKANEGVVYRYPLCIRFIK